MDTLRRVGWMFARLVALAVLVVSAWGAMLAAMYLPSSLSYFLLPLVALLLPTIFTLDSSKEEPVTSS